jgi:hypothetical protein
MSRNIVLRLGSATECILTGCLLVFLWCSSVWAQTGRITIKSQPPGALIWVDDRDFGITPVIDREIDAGVHTLRLKDPANNTTATQTIEVLVDSSITVSVLISGTTGYLTVESKPQGAEVALVTVLGKTPVYNIPINPGAYSIRLEHPKKRFRKETKDVVVGENTPQKIVIPFQYDKQIIGKTTARIFLGAAAIGLFSWGYASEVHGNKIGGIVGFTLGTVSIVGVELIAF